jgi:hypothetical protein
MCSPGAGRHAGLPLPHEIQKTRQMLTNATHLAPVLPNTLPLSFRVKRGIFRLPCTRRYAE